MIICLHPIPIHTTRTCEWQQLPGLLLRPVCKLNIPSPLGAYSKSACSRT